MPIPNALMPVTGESDLSEYIELDPDDVQDLEVEFTENGGAVVSSIGEPVESHEDDKGKEFYANLAETLPAHIVERISSDLIQKIEDDIEARKPRDDQYEEGLRRTGMGKDAPGGASFEGASKVVHPMLTQACVDCNSRLIKELWPQSGPVRGNILGEVTKEKNERAERKVEYMNYQLKTVILEARGVAETTLTQLGMGGVQYIRQWQDHRLKRPRWEFVPVDRIHIPANAASYHSADRRTFTDVISYLEYTERVSAEVYRDLKLPKMAQAPEQTKSEKASDKIEGLIREGISNLDGDRSIYETMVRLEVTDDMVDHLHYEEAGEFYPYLLTIDVESKKTLSMYRNWEQDSPTREAIDHIFEFQFVPWRGAQAIGLPQMVGGLAGGATGALRALLDSAHIANLQGGLIHKGTGTSGPTKTGNPTEFVEIEGGPETTDIRQKVMAYPTREPSTVLFQLLGFLVQAGKETIRTTIDDMPADGANPNTPVGTRFSLVEEGMVVFSSIHGRVHAGFNRLLAGLHRLNAMYLPDVVKVDVQGKEIMVRRKDFEGPIDIQPTSDPEIYSDLQRWAQLGELDKAATIFPQVYNARAIQKRKLKLMKVPDPDELLIPAPEPTELNAVNENLAMAMGKPVTVFPDQDHLAHIQVHLDFGQSPVFGGNPVIQQRFLPAYVQHCAEHICFHYVRMMNDLVTEAARKKASDLMSKDERVKRAFDQLLALASQKIMPKAVETFQGALPVIVEAFQKLQQMMPPQPVDPAHAALVASQAETQRKTAVDQQTGALNQQKLAQDAQNKQQQNAIAAERNQITRENAIDANETRLKQTAIDTQTARDIEAARIASGQGGRFTDGESMRPGG